MCAALVCACSVTVTLWVSIFCNLAWAGYFTTSRHSHINCNSSTINMRKINWTFIMSVYLDTYSQTLDRNTDIHTYAHTTTFYLHLSKVMLRSKICSHKMTLCTITYKIPIWSNWRNGLDTFSHIVTVFLLVTHGTTVKSAHCRELLFKNRNKRNIIAIGQEQTQYKIINLLVPHRYNA